MRFWKKFFRIRKTKKSNFNREELNKLKKDLWDENIDTRINAANILGDILAKQAAKGIQNLEEIEGAMALSHVTGCVTARSVQNAAKQAQDKIFDARMNAQDTEVGRLLLWLEGGRADKYKVVDALVKAGTSAVKQLCQALNHPWHGISANAAVALGRIGDVSAVDALSAALSHKEPRVRACAADALLKIGDLRGIEAIYKTLEETKGDAPIEAAAALGKIADDRSIESLCGALAHVDWRVQKQAIDALVKIAQVCGTDKNNARTRYPNFKIIADHSEIPFSRSSLVTICDSRVVESLYKMLSHSNKDVSRNASEALKKIGAPPSRPALWGA